MRSLFFDATFLVKLHWREPGSTEVLALASSADEIVTSWHGWAEFYSVGLRKLRENLTTPAGIGAVFAQFNADLANNDIRLIPLTESILDRVEHAFLTAPSTTFLRAADAMHLATAGEHGFTEIYSNDKHLIAAAPLFGLAGVNVIP